MFVIDAQEQSKEAFQPNKYLIRNPVQAENTTNPIEFKEDETRVKRSFNKMPRNLQHK